MPRELEGKVAIVTGGASGIGRAIVETYAAAGARVVIADLSESRGHEAARSLGQDGAFIRCDVSDPDDIHRMIGLAVDRFGGIDILVNNAGTTGTPHATIDDDDFADFKMVVNVNLFGPMLATQKAARIMAKGCGGSIVNIASLGGQLPGYGFASYRAAKAALIFFTRCAAIEYGPKGIRANCINPGAIPTDMHANPEPGMTRSQIDRIADDTVKMLIAPQRLKRTGRPQDIADTALFLAGERSSMMTGQVLAVDAGHSIGDANNYADQMMRIRAEALG